LRQRAGALASLPAGTPVEIINRLNAALARIVRDAALLERLSGDGVIFECNCLFLLINFPRLRRCIFSKL
jgi:hypothetical protein